MISNSVNQMCFDSNKTWSEVKLHNFGVKVRVKLGV